PSPSSPLTKPIQYLTNFNIPLPTILILPPLILPPTLLILNILTTSTPTLLNTFFFNTFHTPPLNPQKPQCISSSTLYYSASSLTSSPFVPLFIPPLSKPPSITHFISPLFLLPPILTFLSFTLFPLLPIHTPNKH
ncbi:BCCT family transporter, partial [Staphylococcus aureus]|uniref:BCCT family transporter n=1 Tax=Staphylococcus aureus TaxID=1280 RepID=UPI0016426358